jgi:hypothetical protein
MHTNVSKAIFYCTFSQENAKCLSSHRLIIFSPFCLSPISVDVRSLSTAQIAMIQTMIMNHGPMPVSVLLTNSFEFQGSNNYGWFGTNGCVGQSAFQTFQARLMSRYSQIIGGFVFKSSCFFTLHTKDYFVEITM